jgi:hypothetical protein
LGRLLVYFPDAELSDGAAEAETAGYFDVWNAPPHDTWVGFYEDESTPDDSFRRYLVAWVPNVFEAAVARVGLRIPGSACALC